MINDQRQQRAAVILSPTIREQSQRHTVWTTGHAGRKTWRWAKWT
jgi:hypothetical protein